PVDRRLSATTIDSRSLPCQYLGLAATSSMNLRAIELGGRVPCSQDRTVLVSTPRKSAKSGWLRPRSWRTDRTSAGPYSRPGKSKRYERTVNRRSRGSPEFNASRTSPSAARISAPTEERRLDTAEPMLARLISSSVCTEVFALRLTAPLIERPPSRSTPRCPE